MRFQKCERKKIATVNVAIFFRSENVVAKSGLAFPRGNYDNCGSNYFADGGTCANAWHETFARNCGAPIVQKRVRVLPRMSERLHACKDIEGSSKKSYARREKGCALFQKRA